MEQGSNIIEEEATEMMNVEEVARAIEWFKAMGLSDAEGLINNPCKCLPGEKRVG